MYHIPLGFYLSEPPVCNYLHHYHWIISTIQQILTPIFKTNYAIPYQSRPPLVSQSLGPGEPQQPSYCQDLLTLQMLEMTCSLVMIHTMMTGKILMIQAL